METKNKDLNLRYQAVCMIEAETVLGIGSGDKTILLENPIIRDAFDLPYIPATSLTGVMRHTLEREELLELKALNDLFGFQEKENPEDSTGSRVILSSAYLYKNGQVADGLETALALRAEFAELLKLPLRDHVRIDHRGAAEKHGKFESELLPKGVRFVFEIELWGTTQDQESWETILETIRHPLFRIGSGTRKGFGQLKVIDCWERTLDLKEKSDLDLYLEQSSQIIIPLEKSSKKYKRYELTNKEYSSKLIHYQLSLNSRDFFLFDGQFEMNKEVVEALQSGIQKRADISPKMEQIIIWDGDSPRMSTSRWLLPATSIKGAIAHRLAFHYNQRVGNFISMDREILLKEIQDFVQSYSMQESIEETAETLKEQITEYRNLLSANNFVEHCSGEQNIAVNALFGEALNKEGEEGKGQRGKVLFSDVYINKKEGTEKILNHVSIDRFTGGALETALFSEKVVGTEALYHLDIWVEKDALNDEDIKFAFEQTLKDLVNEQLPLGGGTMRGHGMMQGNILKNKKPL